jgi:uncharacterized membrane protein HdeD (DUF308 family)
MEPLRPFFDLFYMDAMAALCMVLALLAAVSNIRFALRGRPKALRPYMALKGLFSLLVGATYLASLVNVLGPAPPPVMARGLMLGLLAFMAADAILRRPINPAGGGQIGDD